MKKIVSVFTPILLHFIMGMAVALLMSSVMGEQYDTTLAATLTALLVLPIAVWMYRRDGGTLENGMQWKAEKGENTAADSFMQSVHRGTHRIPRLFACILAGAFMNIVWSQILFRTGIQNYFSNSTQEQLLVSAMPLQILGLGILVPMAEEMIFRGLVYFRMRKVMGAGGAIFCSALLFALYHGNMIQILGVFPLALALAWLCERGRWMGYPIAFHMGANLFAVLINYLAERI